MIILYPCNGVIAIHTPYDGSSPPFHIGLSRLDPAEWIDADGLLPTYLDEKERLAASVPEQVFVAESAAWAAQSEVLELLAAHLPARFPEIYRRIDRHLEILPARRRVWLDDARHAPLRIAARLVQEDLLIMRRDARGWRLVTGSLSFPSSWHLGEKFGKLMHEIHAPVPGFGMGTPNAILIQRMFDNLPPDQPFIRWNWGVYDSDQLYHPGAGNGVRNFGAALRGAFLRVERQTLRKLPVCGDILFTIRIYLNPLSVLALLPNRRELSRSIARQIEALSASELAYKGLSEERERLLERLRELSGETLPTR